MSFSGVLLLTLLSGALALAGFGDEPTTLIESDGTELSGVWSLPANPPRWVAVILPGSGNVGADGDVSSPLLGSGYRGASAHLSEQLARPLMASDVASLRYNKRGYSRDATRAFNPPLGLLIQDAIEAMKVAEARFPLAKTAFVGLSEGALISVIAASEHPVDALFLLSLPTRNLNDLLAYQFVEWPVDLLTRNLHPIGDTLSSTALAALGPGEVLPLLGPSFGGEPWTLLDSSHRSSLSISRDLIPAYTATLGQVRALMRSPALLAWYNSFLELPPFSTFAQKITGQVYLYQAQDDAQIDWSWIVADQAAFKSTPRLKLFPGLGHCFAPMDGSIGQIKTSGPIDGSVLDSLRVDFIN